MALLLGSLQLGLLYGILAIGVYISFRILDIPDLTTEGSFTFGLVTSAMFAMNGHFVLGIVLSIFVGGLAGVITGVLQTKCKINPILSGIITMSGLHTVNLAVMNNAVNVSLIGKTEIFGFVMKALPLLSKDAVKCMIAFIFTAIVCLVIIRFFKTHIGLCIRATGDNEAMVSSSSINVDAMKIISLAVSNACVGLSGGLLAQYQGFADISSSVGILVVALASVIIGEVIFGKRDVTTGIISVVVGSIIYRYIMALATATHVFPAFALKLVSACIVAIALSIPAIKASLALGRIKREAAKNAHNR
ncbi:MAG: ABC transporter permease [Candidatus Metalachnospira sp.]|nr:ABC transporter permease [Candidatus Metalachnospira sp.]